MNDNHNKNFKAALNIVEIIVTIIIVFVAVKLITTTVEPQRFKESSYKTIAQEALANIDSAMRLVILNDTVNRKLEEIYSPDKTQIATLEANNNSLYYFCGNLQKYLRTSKKTCTPIENPDEKGQIPCDYKEIPKDYKIANRIIQTKIFEGYPSRFILKNGILINCDVLSDGNYETFLPGQNKTSTVDTSASIKPSVLIYYDVNGKKEPNILGVDQFVIPYASDGRIFE